MRDFLSMTAAQVEGLPPEQAEAALAAWIQARRTELPEALATSTSKAHARLAKRALYQLKSLGLAVKDAASPAPADVKSPAPADPSAGLEAVLSPVVGTGERAVLFAVPVRGGGLEVFQGIISDEFGLVEFGAGRAKRSAYRARLEELEQDGVLKVLRVPLSRMKLELGRALALNERSNTRVPPEWVDALRRHGVRTEDPDLPIPPLEAGDAGDAQAAAALHVEPELAQWMPSEADLTALAQKANELRASPLALTDAQKAEQLRQSAAALVRESVTPEKRRLYARRLWHTAELLDATERPRQAALARAEARRLFHTTEASAFLEQLYVKAVEVAPLGAPTRGPEAAAARMPPPKPR